MILKVGLVHWTANDSRSIQRVSNRVEQIEEAVDDFDDTEAYKSRANHRSCRKRCKFYNSRFLSRNNQHCCYHDFCFQRGGKKCFISTKRKVKGLHRKRRTKYWLDTKKFIEFHGHRRVTFQYNYVSKESISFQKTVLVSQQEFRISKNLEEDLAGRSKTGGTFVNPLCQPITKKKKKKMKQCSPECATIAYPTPANKVVEMNHTKKTKSRRKKCPVNPIPATCSNVSKVKSSTRNISVLSLGSGQPQKKKGSTFQSMCKGTVTVWDLIHSKAGQCMPFVSTTMPSLGPTHSMHGDNVVSKPGTPVPIPLPVSPTLSSSSLVSKRKGYNKASNSQSNPLGIVSSTSNGRGGGKLYAPANSKVKRPLLIPASSSSCNSLSPEVPISAPYTTKPGLSVSQATNVSFDDSAVHFNMQSKRYHSEHKHMTLECSQFLPEEKPSIYKPVSSDHPVPELALPDLSIARSQPTPTMMPSIVATSELQSPSFRPVLKSNTSCTAIEVGNVTRELALNFAAVSRMNNSKSMATPPNYQTKQQSLIDMSRLEPFFETEMSLSETDPFHATLQGTASHQDQFQCDQWKSTSTISTKSESKLANSKSKPVQHSKQTSKASTIEVVTVEDESRRNQHDQACPASLVPTEEKSVKCAVRTQTKCQEPKDLQIHGNHYECKSVCDKGLSCEQARVNMSQATPTIFTVSDTTTKLPEYRRKVGLKELFEDNIVPFAPSILPPQVHIEDSLSGVGCATTKMVAGVHQLADIEGVLCMKKGIASKISTGHEDQTQSSKVTNASRPEKEKPSQKSLITKKQASIELSKEGIKSIILDVMIANGISSQDIPCERKFDKDKVSPYSLRFFATKEMAQFYCSKCKQISQSMAYCYLDLKTSTICHRFLKDCKHCKNWTRPTFRADAIVTMAQNSVRQYFIFKTKSPQHN